jgi:hypothetical protein
VVSLPPTDFGVSRRTQHPHTLYNVLLTGHHGFEAQSGPPGLGWPAAGLARSRGAVKDT